MTSLKKSGFTTVENVSQLKKAREQLKKNQLKLKTLIADPQRQQKQRVEKKKNISEFSSQSTSNVSKLSKFTRVTSGRPPSEDSLPQVHRAIVDLANAGQGADFRDACVESLHFTLSHFKGERCFKPPSLVSSTGF